MQDLIGRERRAARQRRGAPASAAGRQHYLTSLAIDSTAWGEFVQQHPRATLFHHPAWARFIAACYHYHPFVLAILNEQRQIEAGLPMIEVKGLIGGRRWISLPFTDHCAPLTSPRITIADLSAGLAAAQREYDLPRIEVRWRLSEQPIVWTRTRAALHTLDLGPSPDQLFERFTKMHQRNVRKATREEVSVGIDPSLDGMKAYYRLHVVTRRRQGTPVQPWHFFKLLWEQLIAKGLGFVLLAHSGSTCVAGAVFLTWNRTLVYKYGASDLAYTSTRANHLLFWTAIEWGCQHGFETFDWGRSDLGNQGLRDFKSGWGAREEELAYSFISPTPPTQHAEGGLRARATTAAATVIRHSPPQLCRSLGEILYRYAT